MNDLRAVIWKEWRSAFRWRGSRMRAVLTLLTPLAVFAVYIPWDAGDHWVERLLPSAFAALVIPVLVTMLIVPDSFAGERERHTLATLLASRLPDRAILWGKVGFAVALSWGAALVALLLGLVTWNIAHSGHGFTFYAPHVAWFNGTVSLLLAVLSAGVGVLISLRSGTVQEAQQTMGAVLFLPPTVAGPIVLLIGRGRPGFLRGMLGDLGSPRSLLILCALLAGASVVILAATAARFRRGRLLGAG